MENLILILPAAACWLLLRLSLPNHVWDFDMDVVHGSFVSVFQFMAKFASGLIVGDVVLAVYATRHEVSTGAVDFLLAGAVYGILFLVWTVLRYQAYLHARYRRDGSIGESPYTTAQYALTRTLGYSTVAYSVLGLVWAVVTL